MSSHFANPAHGRFMEAARATKPKQEEPKAEAEPKQEGGGATTIHDHGDGSYHVEHSDGSKSDSLPSHLHAVAHVAHHLSGGDKHHIAHHDGGSMHSHGIHEDGTHEGPEEHGDTESLKEHVGRFFGGDGEGESEQPQDDQHEDVGAGY